MEKIFTMIKTILLMLAGQFKSADSKVGVKETTEALIAANEIALLCSRRFADGVQFADFPAFWTAFQHDEEFKAKVEAGWDKRQQIPVEVSDIDVGEGMELAAVQVDYVPKFIETFKKPEAVEEKAEALPEPEEVVTEPVDLPEPEATEELIPSGSEGEPEPPEAA